jgi:hypothetical protein
MPGACLLVPAAARKRLHAVEALVERQAPCVASKRAWHLRRRLRSNEAGGKEKEEEDKC